MSKNNTMKYIISKYLESNPDDTTNYEKELEIRFNTRKFDYVIQKMDFDRVAQKLLSMGFISNDLNGIFMLRISSEFDTHNKNLSNIRSEILGKDNIQHVCKTNQLPNNRLVRYQKKLQVADKGQKVAPYNSNDFQFRLAFNLEENLDFNNPIIKNQYYEKFESLKKTFRYINRVEFTHSKMPIKCHLSTVKSSKRNNNGDYIYERNIQNSNIFNNPETYEIEIEVDNSRINNDNKDQTSFIEQSLQMTIKYILCGIQNTKYPVPYKTLFDIEKQYKQFILQSDNNNIKLLPRQFIGPGSITLQRQHIQPITKTSKEVNIRKNYCVTEKADGERRLLYISGNGHIFAITTNMNIISTGSKTKNNKIYHSLIDCEYIVKNKYDEVIDLYALFDIYFINKKDKRGYPFMNEKEPNESRHVILGKLIKLIKPESIINGKPSPIRIELKQFEYSNDIFNDCNTILQKVNDDLFEYETDGLVFTPTDLSLPKINYKKTWDKSFKWKPPKQNTIDFLVKTNDEVKNDLIEDKIISYKTFTLMCGFKEDEDGYLHPCADVLDDISVDKIIGNDKRDMRDKKNNDNYKPHKFYPTKPYDNQAYICNLPVNYESIVETEEHQLIENNMIVEFYYDFSKPKMWRWIPLRVRYDKTRELRNGGKNYGNSYKVANSNWQSIHHPIEEDMIRTGENIPTIDDEDTYYNRDNKRDYTAGLRDFHNKVVKRMLINSTSNVGDILIDYAVGKGGDFPKWINSNLSFVFGIDKSKDNIENHSDGACARFLNYKKKLNDYPDALFVPGDSSLRITTLDAIDPDNPDSIYKHVTNAVFNKGTKDVNKIGKAALRHYGKAKDGFHVSSCQFAIHYFFEKVSSLENFIQNIVDCTRVGGYFICTSYNGKKMFEYLSKYKKGESVVLKHSNGEKMWEVIKQYEFTEMNNDASCIGYGIDVYQDTINKLFREYLVNYDYFFEVLEKYGFKLLTPEEAKEINLPSTFGSFNELYTQLELDLEKGKIEKNQIGRALDMDKQEKQISFFNSYFVCKKVHHVSQPVKLIDAIIDEEDTILMSEIAKDIDSKEKQDEEDANSEEEKEMTEKLSIEDPFSNVESESSFNPVIIDSDEKDSNTSLPYAPKSNSNDELPTKITIKKTKKTTKKN